MQKSEQPEIFVDHFLAKKIIVAWRWSGNIKLNFFFRQKLCFCGEYFVVKLGLFKHKIGSHSPQKMTANVMDKSFFFLYQQHCISKSLLLWDIWYKLTVLQCIYFLSTLQASRVWQCGRKPTRKHSTKYYDRGAWKRIQHNSKTQIYCPSKEIWIGTQPGTKNLIIQTVIRNYESLWQPGPKNLILETVVFVTALDQKI